MMIGKEKMFKLLSQIGSFSGFFEESGSLDVFYEDVLLYGTTDKTEYIKLIFSDDITIYFEKVEKTENIFCVYRCYLKNKGGRCEFVEVQHKDFYILINDVLEELELAFEN